MINISILGATGYTGLELIKILLGHPKARLASLYAKIDKPERISDIFHELKGRCDMACQSLSPKSFSPKGIDVVFLALPHTVSMEYAPALIDKGKYVIDLSADFRLKDISLYEKFYQHKHSGKKYVYISAYGLPELYKDKIKKARLIANPGCYPTSVILAVAPLLSKGMAETDNIIVDSKSGASGAGRRADLALSFSEVNESIKAYKVGSHQHLPEIEQELSNIAKKKLSITFTPHLIPITRGMLTTAYIRLKKQANTERLIEAYKSFYKAAPFIRIYDSGVMPQTKDVVNTNYCDIGIAVSQDGNTATIVSVIDNLVKGASGQAVQNMNIMLGLDESLGLA